MFSYQVKSLDLRYSPLLHLRNWIDLPVSENEDRSCQPILRDLTSLFLSSHYIQSKYTLSSWLFTLLGIGFIDGLIGINDVKRWPLDSCAVDFLSTTSSVQSVEAPSR